MAEGGLSSDDLSENMLHCLAHWNIAEKWDYQKETDQNALNKRVKDILTVLEKIQNFTADRYYLSKKYKAFCYAFHNGLTSYFEPFLLKWPARTLIVTFGENIEEYIDFPPKIQKTISVAVELMKLYCDCSKHELLVGLRTLDLSRLPLYFRVSDIPLNKFKFEEAGSAKRSDNVERKSKIILNCKISGEAELRELMNYDPSTVDEEMHTRLSFRYLWLDNFSLTQMGQIYKSLLCTDIRGIRLTSETVDIMQLLFTVTQNRGLQFEKRNLEYVCLENRAMQLKTLSDTEVVNIDLAFFVLPNLKCLDLRNNNLSIVLDSFMEDCTPVKSLLLPNTKLGGQALDHLAESHHALHVRHLDLSQNNFADDETRLGLFRIIERFQHLTYLKMSNVQIDEGDVEEFGNTLAVFTKQLRFLDVSNSPHLCDIFKIVMKGLPLLKYYYGDVSPSEEGMSKQKYIEEMNGLRGNHFPGRPVAVHLCE